MRKRNSTPSMLTGTSYGVPIPAQRKARLKTEIEGPASRSCWACRPRRKSRNSGSALVRWPPALDSTTHEVTFHAATSSSYSGKECGGYALFLGLSALGRASPGVIVKTVKIFRQVYLLSLGSRLHKAVARFPFAPHC